MSIDFIDPNKKLKKKYWNLIDTNEGEEEEFTKQGIRFKST